MDKITADAVVKCLEIDVDFYRELTVFLMKKHTNITELNSQTTEVVKRKLDNQKEFVARAGILEKPETYNRNASKVAGGQSSAQVFRQV